MDWLVYRPGAKMVTAAVAIARRLGPAIPDDAVQVLERVAGRTDGEVSAGPLRAFAHTTWNMNRDGDEVPFTSEGVEVHVDGGMLVVDSLGACVRGSPRGDLLAVAQAWDVEELVPRLDWLAHPTLPQEWHGAVKSADLQDPRVLWSTSVTTTSYAVVPRGEDAFLVAVASNGHARSLASILGRWTGGPAWPWHHWTSKHAATPQEMAGRISAAPLLEWEARECSPVPLWYVHLKPGEDVSHHQRWRAGNHVMRSVERSDGGGTARVIQPWQGADWCAHLEGVRIEGHWHWSGFSTHPAGKEHLEGLAAGQHP
jgi:hypothetical protein